jgi:phosphoribosylglycinamide formyltransferase-1
VANPPPLRIAVLVSGRGSNLAALIRARDAGTLPVQIVAVGTDRPACAAAAIAQQAGIAVVALRPRHFASRPAYDRALFESLHGFAPDLVVLAGYMRIIDAAVVAAAPWPMINLHPSLLPKYTGLDTHARALAAGDRCHGASVHVVIPALDAGPVLAQVRIDVRDDDTPETLAARLRPREHVLLVSCVRWIAQRRLRLGAGAIQFDGRRLERPLQLDADDAPVPDPDAAAAG